MRKKVYAVEFNQYTNCMCNTVSDDGDLASTRYVDMPEYGSFLIFEDQIEFYKQFGQGFKQLTYVGEIEVENEE